jgi:putative SOS response-associated peptidase YedK
MCGRYTNTAGVDELNDRLGFPIRGERGTGRYNIAPTEEVLAIVAPHGEAQARMLRWGLIPPGAKDLKRAGRLINARVESVASKRPFASLLPKASRRALQVADGYFEWLAPERNGQPRQPFYFQLDGGVPFAFAALWTPAKVGEEWIESVTLLTCDSTPNHLAAAIHNRMPVILADEQAQRAWLDSALAAEDVLTLCQALPAARLTARPVNPAVNRADPDKEGPELLVAPT